MVGSVVISDEVLITEEISEKFSKSSSSAKTGKTYKKNRYK